ncbi:phage tail family protein [Bacillus mycoides]|uniref:phage tail domain-containing protein n=1 Tax=Bacillus mycoides TaxID=1405 RepID=UPI001C00AE6B|nr:phage tail domain-containing protein [Bacillus mycoides]QWH13264.1 phage tail family protein [Bacillus mycoides]
MHLIIERMNGKRYKLSKETGYIVLKFRPESIKVNRLREKIDGRSPVSTGTEIEGRSIHIEILFESNNFSNYTLKRNEFFQMLDSREEFYVVSSEEPGKRWLVSAESFTPEPVTNVLGRCNIVLFSDSPYAESIGKTTDPMTFKSGLWQFGQGLSTETMQYVHRTKSFRIFNAGDVMINPKEYPLLIRFRGSSENLKIINKTTGDEWSWTGITTGDSKTGEVIQLKGVQSFKGVNSIFGKTNFKLINIIPRWNEFELTGVTGDFYISFDFRFYYL